MSWPVIGLPIVFVSFLISRIWVRRWIVRNWLDDKLTDRQAAATLLLTQFAPMLLFIGIVVVTSPSSIPFFLLVAILVVPIWIATWGALFTYMVNHGVKEQMRNDREARLQ